MEILNPGNQLKQKTLECTCTLCECRVLLKEEDVFMESYQKYWLNRYYYICPNCREPVNIGAHNYHYLKTKEAFYL